jgi:hypothetical protein
MAAHFSQTLEEFDLCAMSELNITIKHLNLALYFLSFRIPQKLPSIAE